MSGVAKAENFQLIFGYFTRKQIKRDIISISKKKHEFTEHIT